MAANDARPVPRKNVAFRAYFDIRKSDGTLITGWTGADSEVSIDGGTFVDCTNEAIEIGTSGCGYIDLTASEMNGDAVVYKLTVTNTSALPLVIVFYPEEIGDYRADMVQVSGDTVAADRFETMLDGTGGNNLTLKQLNITPGAFEFGINIDANATAAGGILITTNNAQGLVISSTNAAEAIYLESTSADTVAIYNVARSAVSIQNDASSFPAVNIFTLSNARALNIESAVGDAVTIRSNGGNGDAIQLFPNGTGLGINGTIGTVNNLTNLPSIPANWLTAAGIANNAITSAKIATDAIGAAQIATDADNAIAAAVWATTLTLPGQVAPSNTPSASGALTWMYKLSRNKTTSTSTLISVFDDAGTVVDNKATVSDNGTIFTREEFGSGP